MSPAGGPIRIERPEYFDGRARVSDRPAVILVRGTGHGEWADPDSPFRKKVIEPAGLIVAATAFGPLRLVDPRPQWLVIAMAILKLIAAGLFDFLVHSHGLQPAVEAIARARARRLVSISGPIRSEMMPTYREAARRCERVVQIADAGTDWTQIAGQVFGRHAPPPASATTSRSVLGIRSRNFPAAPNVDNTREPGIGHSEMLYRQFDQARRLILPAFKE